MSGDSAGEKTEEPTAKKLRDLRKKGQVAKSKEVVSTSLIVVMFLYVGFAASGINENFKAVILSTIGLIELPIEEALTKAFTALLVNSAKIVIPFVVIVVVIGILGNIMQTGVMFSGEPVKLDLKKIDPIQGAKKIFSQSNFVEFLKSVVKVIAVTACVAYVIIKNIKDLVYAPSCGVECLISVFSVILWQMLVYVCLIFVVVAIVDLVYQRYEFIRKNKMTKDQVKKDYKETEGDPEIKSKRKKLQRELASGKQMESVKRASVVVKNPTHFAVAIRYNAKDAPLPIVLAKGENIVAKQILKIAEENGIPIMENVPLAQGLFAEADVGAFIPIDFIPAVVEVLHWVRDNRSEYVRRN